MTRSGGGRRARARSRFTAELPDLIRRYVDEPRIAYRAKKLKEPLDAAPAPAAPPAATEAKA